MFWEINFLGILIMENKDLVFFNYSFMLVVIFVLFVD